MSCEGSHYRNLNLNPTSALSAEEIKAAYRKALLKYHPDRETPRAAETIEDDTATAAEPRIAPRKQDQKSGATSAPSVDEIVTAYETLKDGKRRADYDRFLALQSRPRYGFEAVARYGRSNHDDVETYDLDDLTYEQTSKGEGNWYKACRRCGHESGYVVSEEELEGAVDDGRGTGGSDGREEKSEVLIPCKGCSLIIRVVFAVDSG